MRWTEERVERLIALWNGGASGAQISDEMGVSRAGIIGKVNRLLVIDLPPVVWDPKVRERFLSRYEANAA